MPIFEYICKECQKPFEALVLGSQKPECPRCHSRKLEQLISVFSVGAGGRSSASAPEFSGCGGGACGLPPGPGGCCQADEN